ncbi:MAG: M23 family metallopeptidase [Clostridia bacterium]|nr:M23 family metallopeptidase [Clostridia bacterium]
MVSRNKNKVLAVYAAVVLLIFALCVPVLQKKITQKFQPGNSVTWPLRPNNKPQTAGTAGEAGEAGEVGTAGTSAPSESFASDSAPVLEANLCEIVWPIQGQVLRGVGISYAQTFSDYRYHDGIDIQAVRGAEVVAALAGKVISKETTKEEGTKVTLEHGQGWVSIYAHLEEVYPQVGAYCATGDPLGIVNQPGLQEVLEGVHLHYTLCQDGQIMNPLDYLPEMP